MPERSLVYVRQSQSRKGEDESTSLSLDSQDELCRQRCESLGWYVVDTIRDHDLKGDDPDRPGMLDLMGRAKRKEMTVVCVFAMSRFARDSVWQEITYRQLRAYGVAVESVKEPNINHTLMRGMLGVMNQYSSEQTGQFIGAAIGGRARRGLSWGRVPFGYDRVDKLLVPHPVEAAIVEEIFRLFIAGRSLRRIAAELIDRRIPCHAAESWPPQTVAWILHNPVYAGGVRLKGAVVAWDAHEAIVSRDTWEAAQARFAAPRVREKPVCRSWAEGHVEHACGARMYLTMVERTHKGGLWADGYPSFRCANFTRVGRRCEDGRQHIGLPLLEPALRAALILDLRDAIDPKMAARRLAKEAGSSRVVTERADIARQLAALAEQRKEAEGLVLSRRRDVQWLDGKDAEITAAEAVLLRRLAALPAVPDGDEIAARWARIKLLRPRVVRLDGEGIASVLDVVGVGVVGRDGVSIRYNPWWRDLIPEPAVIDPRAVPDV